MLNTDTVLTLERFSWTLEDAGDGYYHVVNQFTGLSLDVEDASSLSGARVRQWGRGKRDDSDQWCFLPTGGTSSGDSQPLYEIVNKKSGKVLDVAYKATDSSALLVQYLSTGADNQHFVVMEGSILTNS